MLFEFNLYSALLLLPVVHGLIFGTLLLLRYRNDGRLSDALLAALVLLYVLYIASWMLGFAGWYDAHDWHSTFMFYFPFAHWLWFGPLTLWYFRSLVDRNFSFGRKHYLHLLPGLAWVAVYAVNFLLDAAVYRSFPMHFGTRGPLAQGGPLIGVLEYLAYPSLAYYLFLTLRDLRAYRKYVEANYSDTDKMRLDWLRWLMYGFAISLAIWLGFDAANLFLPDRLTYADLWYKYFAWGILLYGISIGGYTTRWDQQTAPEFRPDPQEESLPALLDKNQLEQLRAYMDVQRPYLDAGLTLYDLSRQTGIPATTLSRLINQGFQKNFNDFINSYRVAAVQQKIADPQYGHLSLLGIAYECGFNSKATFNRAFKKSTGISPSEFQQQNARK